MFPDLSYILHYFFGTEPDNATSIVKTFGLFLAIAFIVAAVMLGAELYRKEKEGLLQATKVKKMKGAPATVWELVSNGIFGFILGFKVLYAVLNFPEFKADAADVLLSPKGNIIGGILGAVAFMAFKYWEKNKSRLEKPHEVTTLIRPHEHIGDITIVAAISGIVGAKIFALIEDLPSFFADPLGTFFSGSGMAIYGGLIGGFAITYLYVKRKGMNPIHVMDAVAPALMVAYGVGRMGCHFSGDGDWGIVNELAKPGWMAALPDWMWAYDYPQNVINSSGHPYELIPGCTDNYCTRLVPKVYPTPIYEIIMAFLIGGFLWAIRKRVKIAGLLFFIYVIFNGAERFLIEKIRVNDKYDIFGIQSTQAEIIAVCLMLIGIIGSTVLILKAKKGKPKA